MFAVADKVSEWSMSFEVRDKKGCVIFIKAAIKNWR